MEQNLIIFAVLSGIGLLTIILGFKFSEKARKTVETTGAILFHVGVFGILYYKVSINLFISLFALVLSLFILIDPLKISNYLNHKIYRLVGYMLLFAAVAFSLDYFSGFPVWLWIIPLVIYLSPYLFSSLKNRLKSVLALAWLVVFFYMGLIGYVIYTKYNPNANVSFITKLLPQVHVPENANNITIIQKKQSGIVGKDTLFIPNQNPVETITPPANIPDPHNLVEQNKLPVIDQSDTTTPTQDANIVAGPYLKNLQDADDQYLKLQKDYERLRDENKKLKEENTDLKKRLGTGDL